MFEIIKNNGRFKKSEIAKMIGKSEMTVQRAISKLVETGLIERVGSNKTGYWKVIE